MDGKIRYTVDGRRLKNELFVVILRSLPQADDEESEKGRKTCSVKRTWEESGDGRRISVLILYNPFPVYRFPNLVPFLLFAFSL